MACVSLSRSPLASDLDRRSLPARSIRFSMPAHHSGSLIAGSDDAQHRGEGCVDADGLVRSLLARPMRFSLCAQRSVFRVTWNEAGSQLRTAEMTPWATHADQRREAMQAGASG
jgi:hypothetical protein